MIPLSVVIIAFNEERNIERCIKSVLSIADDIVIVDSYSSDKTPEIARNLGARVIQHPFQGHIEQKNYALTQAKHKHIFSLDADEYPDETLISEIKKIKQNWLADAYSMNRLNNYCGQWIRHGAWYPDIKLRLFNKEKGSWQGINPHDRFLVNETSVVKHIKGNILHYSYYTIEEHNRKINYFSEIASKAYFQKGKRSNLLKIIFNPLSRFVRDYIFKLGFLDGKYGFIIAKLNAREVKLKYQKLLNLQQGQAL